MQNNDYFCPMDLLNTFTSGYLPGGHEHNQQIQPPYRRSYSPIEILKDPAAKNFKERVITVNEGTPVDLNFDTDVRGYLSKCARYVKDLSHRASGISPENTGVHGNAWHMYANILNSGGKPVFNIYDAPQILDAAKKDSKEVKKRGVKIKR